MVERCITNSFAQRWFVCSNLTSLSTLFAVQNASQNGGAPALGANLEFRDAICMEPLILWITTDKWFEGEFGSTINMCPVVALCVTTIKFWLIRLENIIADHIILRFVEWWWLVIENIMVLRFFHSSSHEKNEGVDIIDNKHIFGRELYLPYRWTWT